MLEQFEVNLLNLCPSKNLELVIYHLQQFAVLVIVLMSINSNAIAASNSSVKLTENSLDALGQYIEYFQEDSRLSYYEAVERFNSGVTVRSTVDVLSLGIGAKPVWLTFSVENNTGAAIINRLSIETSWLDETEIYMNHAESGVIPYIQGDQFPYHFRDISHNFFAIDYNFLPGTTQVVIRVESNDPMVIPIYLNEPDIAKNKDVFFGYYYGAVYGSILALLFYNLILYAGIRLLRYLHYTLFLAVFLITNMSYTGHGYRWLWPDYPIIQQWVNPISITFFGFALIYFAVSFLETRTNYPRWHFCTKVSIWLVSLLLLLFIVLNSITSALFLSFGTVIFYSVMMLAIAIFSLIKGNKLAPFFLIASVLTAFSSIYTALTVWGVIDYSFQGYHAIEVGTVFNVVILALALTYLFRINQESLINAEQQARTDTLTGLNNRRAFYEQSENFWYLLLRGKLNAAVVMLDIDHFKQLNDEYGHPVGDCLLQEIGQILTRLNRSGDILARWGGEEFILFIPNCSESEAIVVAERLRKAIAQEIFEINNIQHRISISVGVVTTENKNQHVQTELSLDSLIKLADEQLYKAKSSGRNQVSSMVLKLE